MTVAATTGGSRLAPDRAQTRIIHTSTARKGGVGSRNTQEPQAFSGVETLKQTSRHAKRSSRPAFSCIAPTDNQLADSPEFLSLTYAQQRVVQHIVRKLRNTDDGVVRLAASHIARALQCTVRTVRTAYRAIHEAALIEVYETWDGRQCGNGRNSFQLGAVALSLRGEKNASQHPVKPHSLNESEKNNFDVPHATRADQTAKSIDREVENGGALREGRCDESDNHNSRARCRKRGGAPSLEQQQRTATLQRMREILAQRQELTRLDHLVLLQISQVCPIDWLDEAVRCAHGVHSWEACEARGATLRRKLVAIMRECHAELPAAWRDIKTSDFEAAMEYERRGGAIHGRPQVAAPTLAAPTPAPRSIVRENAVVAPPRPALAGFASFGEAMATLQIEAKPTTPVRAKVEVQEKPVVSESEIDRAVPRLVAKFGTQDAELFREAIAALGSAQVWKVVDGLAAFGVDMQRRQLAPALRARLQAAHR